MITAQIAKQLKDVYFGGNWTSVCFKEVLKDVSWQQATVQLQGLNTIATLVFHSGYYIGAVLKVLQGEPLNASDKLSFEHSLISNDAEWQALLAETWQNAEAFAAAIAQLPDAQLAENFTHEQYGNYYHNLHGIVEHCHYHLGQIVIIKKLLQQNNALA